MKIFRTLLLCAALVAGTVVAVQAQDDAKKAKTEKVTFDVSMHCENCKAKIEKNIAWEKGVKDLSVDLEKKQVTIKYDPKKTSEAALKKAIEKLGYKCEKPGEKTEPAE